MSSRGRGSEPVLGAAHIGAFAAVPAAGAAPECKTRDWAAWEPGHRDLGAGRVNGVWSWSAESVADDIVVMACAHREGLRARMRFERMQARLPHYGRRQATRRLETLVRAPHVFSFDRLATALAEVNVARERMAPTEAPCACEAFCPGALAAGAAGSDQPAP